MPNSNVPNVTITDNKTVTFTVKTIDANGILVTSIPAQEFTINVVPSPTGTFTLQTTEQEIKKPKTKRERKKRHEVSTLKQRVVRLED